MSNEQIITIDGIKTVVRTAGDQSLSEAVLLLHGNPGPSDDWEDVIPDISRFARVIAPDMPYYGRTDRPADFDCSVQGYADFLGKIINTLDVKKVHLVLHDFGGPWGLTWACDHPDRIASLSLVNVGIAPGYQWHKFARIWRTPILGELFQLLSNRFLLGRSLNQDNPKPLPKAFINRIDEYSDWAQKMAVLRLYRSTSEFDSLANAVTSQLKPLRIPTNVIWGDSDPFVSAEYAEAQRAVFDVRDIHIMPQCGHWPMIDEPEDFKRLLLPFLESQVAT